MSAVKAALDNNQLRDVESGNMVFMMSKSACLYDAGDHNGSHLMFFTALEDGSLGGWRIGLAGCFRSLPVLLHETKMRQYSIDNKSDIGGGGGSRTRVRKCYWSRDYMLIPVHALGITPGRSRLPLRTDKKRQPLA